MVCFLMVLTYQSASFLSMQTSVAIKMRNIAWVYKYWALEDPPLILDSQRSTAEFRSNIYLIDETMNTVDSKYDRMSFACYQYIHHD